MTPLSRSFITCSKQVIALLFRYTFFWSFWHVMLLNMHLVFYFFKNSFFYLFEVIYGSVCIPYVSFHVYLMVLIHYIDFGLFFECLWCLCVGDTAIVLCLLLQQK